MTHFVNCESLNLRSAPRVAADTLIGPIFLGHPVRATGPEDPVTGFVPVKTRFEGRERAGFVAAKFLRDAVSAPREALIAAAVAEWHRFERGQGLEFEDPFFKFVGEMWKAINIDLDGRDRDVPWSAAAISFVVRKAAKAHAAYGKFKFADGHARYVHDSIRKREAGETRTPFWGFRITERKPQLGDIVCKNRGDGITFDVARRTDQFRSHCDIVVAIDSPANRLLALGGNVAQSFETTEYRLAPGDFLATHTPSGETVFALLANRVDPT
jgi:hypothetical protein